MVKSWTNEDGVEIEIVEEQETLLLQKEKEFPLFKHLNRKIKNASMYMSTVFILK